jgi:hypothetical protein
MRTPAQHQARHRARHRAKDLITLGPAAAFLGSGALVAWAGVVATLRDTDAVLAAGEYWANAGFMALGASLLTGIAALLVWVVLDDPQRA